MSAYVLDAPRGFAGTGSSVGVPGSGLDFPMITEARLLAVLGLPTSVLGTGSDLVNTLMHLSVLRPTGSRTSSARAEHREYIEPGKPISEIVNAIRKSFALSVTDLAAVLGVERPTIYSWLKDQSSPSPARLQRMGLVLRLADTWTAATNGAATPVLSARTESGMELLRALKEPKLWETEILDALSSQAAAAASRSRRSRLSTLARERGLEMGGSADFDIATGRPLGPEEL